MLSNIDIEQKAHVFSLIGDKFTILTHKLLLGRIFVRCIDHID